MGVPQGRFTVFDLFEHLIKFIDKKSDLVVIPLRDAQGIIFFDGNFMGRARELPNWFRDQFLQT